MKRESKSLWMEITKLPTTGKLKTNLRTEVCVVGAGISGMTTAYLLACEGKKVVVLDKGKVAGGETCRTTAHLANAIDDRYVRIEKIHGEEGARLAAESHTAAIDLIEAICKKEEIRCDLRRLDGYLFTPPGEKSDLLQKELEAAHRAGLSKVKLLDKIPVPRLSDGPCLLFPRQAQIHPTKYLGGLTAAFLEKGGRVYSDALVTSVEGGEKAVVKTKSGYEIKCEAVVVASNTPLNDRFIIHTKQEAYRTYAIGFHIPQGSIPIALYWDTLDPYHYIRVQHEEERSVLIVGGEDHRTGQSADETEALKRLEAWAREHFPQVGEALFKWSGQVEETVDGLAYIGRNPQDEANVYIATGDSGMGMTHGTIAGKLITDLILGRENPWAKLYDPARKTVRSLSEWVKGNFNTVLQYGDYLTPGEVKSPEDVPMGEGAVVRRGLEKVAVFRDEAGKTHEMTAVCPHLGGIVRWNTEEKTWDCPCHGSRFTCKGSVISGPATEGLAVVEKQRKTG